MQQDFQALKVIRLNYPSVSIPMKRQTLAKFDHMNDYLIMVICKKSIRQAFDPVKGMFLHDR